MVRQKTQLESDNAAAWLSKLEPERRRAEAQILDSVFQKATGFAPQVWTGGMIGYGSYTYTYKTGRSGSWLATGFAARKAKISVYIMPGYTNFDPILGRLGKHSKGKSCLCINKLADVDLDVLAELIQAGLADLAKTWPVQPS